MADRHGVAYATPAGLEYERYIASKRWTRKRQEYWAENGRSCKVPGCEVTTNLHVHHHTYKRLGNERMSDLLGLCEYHHDQVHDLYDSLKSAKHPLTLTGATERVTGLRLREAKKPVKQPRKKTRTEKLWRVHQTNPPKTPCGCRTCKPKKEKQKQVRTVIRTSRPSRYDLVGGVGIFKKDVGICVCGKTLLKRGDAVQVVFDNKIPGPAPAITGRMKLQRVDCPTC